MTSFTTRIATEADLPALRALMARAIAELQSAFLDPAQVAASHKVMGLDTQLVADRTYHVVDLDGQIAGCGGWSFRATLYGGDDSIVAREPAPLDPATDAAKIRAMYTNPDFARRGVGSVVLAACEAAAQARGFRRTELMATAAGVPLYRRAGYVEAEPVRMVDVDGVGVPLVRMVKQLTPAG
jgi:GNAT superfamily N-acetyltransferase